MVPLIPYIFILLAISAVAMIFIYRVIRRQVNLFKRPISQKDIKQFRHTLFAISVVIVIMGAIPIAINTYSLLIELGTTTESGRPSSISPISFIYSLGVHIQTLLLSYLLWRIYKLANDDDE